MMAVFELDAYRNQDTVAVLKNLYNQAVKGNVTGVDLCFTDRRGVQHFFRSGAYSRSAPPSAAPPALKIVRSGRQPK
jgi:hypothetical protein